MHQAEKALQEANQQLLAENQELRERVRGELLSTLEERAQRDRDAAADTDQESVTEFIQRSLKYCALDTAFDTCLYLEYETCETCSRALGLLLISRRECLLC